MGPPTASNLLHSEVSPEFFARLRPRVRRGSRPRRSATRRTPAGSRTVPVRYRPIVAAAPRLRSRANACSSSCQARPSSSTISRRSTSRSTRPTRGMGTCTSTRRPARCSRYRATDSTPDSQRPSASSTTRARFVGRSARSESRSSCRITRSCRAESIIATAKSGGRQWTASRNICSGPTTGSPRAGRPESRSDQCRHTLLPSPSARPSSSGSRSRAAFGRTATCIRESGGAKTP